MTNVDLEAAFFSAKSFVAAMAAYWASLAVGFSQPVWAIATVYLVSQPFAGAVVLKGLFRLGGTVVGAAAAVVLVPNLVDEPLVLSLALSIWIGLCAYIAKLDRTPRSYAFLLAGYSAGIVGFPSVLAPGGVFDVAILRVQEIGIGIVCASLAHGIVWPRTATARLQARVGATLQDAERWSRDVLAVQGGGPSLDAERRRLAVDVGEVDQLGALIAFDGERDVPRIQIVRAFQDQVSWLLPLIGVVEDRIREIGRGPGELPAEIADLLGRGGAWLGEVGGGRNDALVAEADALQAPIVSEGRLNWQDLLLMSLLARFSDLMLAHQTLRDLRERIRGNRTDPAPAVTELVKGAAARSFHRDHGLAVRSAVGTTAGIFAVCLFWIFTAWRSGATAAVIASISCALFAGFPAPGLAIRRFFNGSLLGIGAAAVLGFLVFPRITDMSLLVMAMSPLLLLLGSMQARPPLALLALGAIIGFVNTVGLSSTYQSDFGAFVNGSLAQIVGTVMSILFVGIFQDVSAGSAVARLFRSGFRDIAARAEGRATDTRLWTNRMIDRTAMITARAASPGSPLSPYDALVGLRVGYIAGELHGLLGRPISDPARVALSPVLERVARHFRRIRPTAREAAAPSVLEAIDGALAAFKAQPGSELKREGLVLLTGLRRSLFPQAQAFEADPA